MATQTDKLTTVTFDIDPELGKRIEAVAAARNLSVPDYVAATLRTALKSEHHTGMPLRDRLSDEERERGIRAAAELDRLRHELFVKNGRKKSPPSWKLINEMRDERTRELMQAHEE